MISLEPHNSFMKKWLYFTGKKNPVENKDFNPGFKTKVNKCFPQIAWISFECTHTWFLKHFSTALSPKHSPFIVLSVTKDKATGLQLCSLDLCCENFSEEDDLFPSS
jgi:hypothetical protein